ncbi:MAG: hypothetical protein WKG06_08915 [Segetibacter sp.]
MRPVKTALLHSTLLSIPITISLSFFYSANIYIVFAFLGLGYVYLISIVLGKYSALPEKINFFPTVGVLHQQHTTFDSEKNLAKSKEIYNEKIFKRST